MTRPTIAMVGGDAVGGGMFMSLACDLRLVAEHARFGAPVARTLGNFAAPFSLGLLAATVGPVRAREIVLTARLVSAADAKAMGLVDEVLPAAALRGPPRPPRGPPPPAPPPGPTPRPPPPPPPRSGSTAASRDGAPPPAHRP